jgi:nitrile hydratase accessory protein
VLAGDLAPPMSNGEVVFEAPWQGRLFGMAKALADAGTFEWNDFRRCLIDELARAETGTGQPSGQPFGEPFVYYDHFLRALERVLASRGLLAAAARERREAIMLTRPHGHVHPAH